MLLRIPNDIEYTKFSKDATCSGRWIVFVHVFAMGYGLKLWNGSLLNPAGGSVGQQVANARIVS